MSFATNLRTTASSLLTTYGRSVTLGRVTEGAYNTTTSGLASGTTTSYTGVGHPSPYKNSEIDHENILSSDIKLMLYTTTTPLIGDTATIDAVIYRVQNVLITNAQGLNIVYTLQLRT